MILRTMTALLALQLTAPLALEYAPPPSPPENSLDSEVIVLNVGLNEDGFPNHAQVELGAASFTAPVVAAVREWKFRNETRKPQMVSVTVFFRARTIFPDQTRYLTGFADRRDPGDAPPLPINVTDPGFPPTSVAEGIVIVQVDVDAQGEPAEIHVVNAVDSLTHGTVQTIRQWRFRPAIRGGRAVPGTAIVAISYLRPVVVGLTNGPVTSPRQSRPGRFVDPH
ncbi:MAG TPA: energy transducer TonB [Terriglobia bacterium]|nr:energy transducer TonB [Terriglobia bacterium]